ncbi:MAG: pantetheine-phosphate adenylyltransferase [candidate division Zixibacteria bacterium]|nr:pantetheine-phosphate adenylyltransferase [candidate division Zixibacteria bacterium]
MRTALYPGTFDPMTNGHIDILRQAVALFDQVVVAVAPNLRKMPLFTVEERITLIGEAVGDMSQVSVVASEELTVDLARRLHACAIIRGIRIGGDFETEYQMALMNRQLAPEIHTVCFFPGEPNTYVSSTLIKEVARFGGDISRLVPSTIAEGLARKFHSLP